MKRLRQLAGLVTLMLAFGTPLMACLVAGAEMSAAERECCKQIAQRCGSMDMPSSHSCCQTEVRQAGPMLHVERVNVAAHLLVAMTGNIPAIGVVHSFHVLKAERHPPPESPPSSSSILRI